MSKISQNEIDNLILDIDDIDSDISMSNSIITSSHSSTGRLPLNPLPMGEKVKRLISCVSVFLKNKNPKIYQDGAEFYISVEDLKNCYVNLINLHFKK